MNNSQKMPFKLLRAVRVLRAAMLVSALALATGCAVQPVADANLTLTRPGDLRTVRQALRHGDWLVTRGVHVPDNMVAV